MKRCRYFLFGARALACTRLLPLLFVLTLPAAAQAQFDYTTNNGTITITGYTGLGGDLTIPSTLNGLSVTSIGDWAFQNINSLTSVTIPNSVLSIGDAAFLGCTSLTAVYFEGDAPNIGSFLFLNADKVAVYYLPGTMGWGTTFGGRPTALWLRTPEPVIEIEPLALI